MKFWQIAAPRYPDGDYGNTFINGTMGHDDRIPLVRCDACSVWGSSETLSVALPTKLSKREELKVPPMLRGWQRPLPPAENRALRLEVERALAEEGQTLTLRPGDRFPPARVKLPSFPEADFLWPGFGTIVSGRIRDLFAAVRGASFCPVVWEKVGLRRAKLPAPEPREGEPEDLLNLAGYKPSRLTRWLGLRSPPTYFEMVVARNPARPPGTVTRGTCEACGREELDVKEPVVDLAPGQWKGDDVFSVRNIPGILVTDTAKQALEHAHATNVRFTSLPLPAP